MLHTVMVVPSGDATVAPPSVDVAVRIDRS